MRVKIICVSAGAAGAACMTGAALLYACYKKRIEIAWNLTSFYSYARMYVMPRKIMSCYSVDCDIPYCTFESSLSIDYKCNNQQYKITYLPKTVLVFPPYDSEELSKFYVPDYEYYVCDEEKSVPVTEEKKEKILMVSGPLKNFYEDKDGIQSPRTTLLKENIIKQHQHLVLYDILLDEEKKY